MKYSFFLLVFLAACSPKNQGPNKFSDAKLINIYELQDRRDVDALLPLLKAKKENHRIAAAMAFASIQDTIAIPYLNQMLQIDQDPMPRRAAAYALGQIGSSKALSILIAAFDQELFPANRPFVMEAIGKCGDTSTINLFENVEYQEILLQKGWAYGVFRLGLKGYKSDILHHRMMKFLNNDDKELAILASHYIYRNLREKGDRTWIDSLIRIAKYDEIKERFATLREDKLISGLLKWEHLYSLSDYKKIELINKKESWDKDEITELEQLFADVKASAVLRGTAFTSLLANTPSSTHQAHLEAALTSEDMALQSMAAKYLQKTSKTSHDWLPILNQIKSQLQLPRQAETYIDVCKALAHLGGEPFDGYQPNYNNPIDWDFVKTISKNQQVLIKTNKGDIRIQLLVEDAPGSVSNFLKLVDSGFYSNKFFHRVVPQFVVQVGCPRGDGWGSLDWTQRSEFSNYQSYEAGTVGIASAGKDTEGVQFFITHCPTPHLDGRYTIFARVIQGMDVVNAINVGDRIIEIKRVHKDVNGAL